jgi:hypothetical protein
MTSVRPVVSCTFAAGLKLAGIAKGEVVMKLENDGEREDSGAWELDFPQERPERPRDAAALAESEAEARSDGEILMLFE